MSAIASVIALQNSIGQIHNNNAPAPWYFVIALVAVVVGLFVLMFIRASVRSRFKR